MPAVWRPSTRVSPPPQLVQTSWSRRYWDWHPQHTNEAGSGHRWHPKGQGTRVAGEIPHSPHWGGSGLVGSGGEPWGFVTPLRQPQPPAAPAVRGAHRVGLSIPKPLEPWQRSRMPAAPHAPSHTLRWRGSTACAWGHRDTPAAPRLRGPPLLPGRAPEPSSSDGTGGTGCASTHAHAHAMHGAGTRHPQNLTAHPRHPSTPRGDGVPQTGPGRGPLGTTQTRPQHPQLCHTTAELEPVPPLSPVPAVSPIPGG